MDPTKVYEAADSLIVGMDDTERSGYFEHLRALYPQELGEQALSGAGVAPDVHETPLTTELLHKKEVLTTVDKSDIECHLKRMGNGQITQTEQSGMQYISRAPSPDESDDEEQDTNRIIEDAMISAMNNLSYRERKVIAERLGLDGERPRTLRKVGSDFDISTARIRQIQSQAQRKIYVLIQREAAMIGKE